MTENEIIYVIPGRKLLRKFIQRLILSPEFIFLIMSQTVVSRPSVTEAEGNPRMQHAEKELRHAVVEQATKKSVSCRNRSQTVAMAETESFSSNLYKTGLFKALHSQLLEIAVRPHVMVSLEEVHLHPSVHQTLQS